MQRFPELAAPYADWVCADCGGPLVPCLARAAYMGSGFDIELLGCPQCRSALVYEDLAEGKMREVELVLEDK